MPSMKACWKKAARRWSSVWGAAGTAAGAAAGAGWATAVAAGAARTAISARAETVVLSMGASPELVLRQSVWADTRGEPAGELVNFST